MSKHKSFNPFKMWGSYVGVTFGFIIGLLYVWIKVSCGNHCGDYGDVIPHLFGLATNVGWSFLSILNSWIWLLSLVLIGFLLGWGIHSLFRAVRK